MGSSYFVRQVKNPEDKCCNQCGGSFMKRGLVFEDDTGQEYCSWDCLMIGQERKKESPDVDFTRQPDPKR